MYPAHVTKGLQGIPTHWQDGHGYGLFVGEHGDVALEVGSDGNAQLIVTERRSGDNAATS